MFGLGKKKQSDPVFSATPVILPAPTPEDYELTEEQQRNFDDLVVYTDGMVNLDDVTHGLMRMQSQYIARHLDKSVDRVPFLGEGLRFEVDSSSHHDYNIHKDDVLEFVARVRAARRNR